MTSLAGIMYTSSKSRPKIVPFFDVKVSGTEQQLTPEQQLTTEQQLTPELQSTPEHYFPRAESMQYFERGIDDL
jgi:hypothetical protein